MSGQITRFGLQPLADDGGALLATAYLQQIVTEGTLISRKFTRPGVTDARRFPPWFVEEQPTCFVVRDHNGQALAYVGTYRSNCNVKLTAMDRLKPSRSAKSHVGSITLVASSQSNAMQPNSLRWCGKVQRGVSA